MNSADLGLLRSKALILDAGPVTRPPFQLPAADARKSLVCNRGINWGAAGRCPNSCNDAALKPIRPQKILARTSHK